MKKTPLRVLIVEDSEDDCLLVARKLKTAGYEVEFERVETPEAMKAALERQEWDIVFSDYRMPQFSAPQALKVFQESALDIPFFVISGTVGEDVAVDMMRAGAHDYIMKDNLIRLAPDVKRELRDAEVRRAGKLAEERIVHLNSVLRAIRAVNQLLVRERDPDRLIKQACDCLMEARGFFSAWIVLLDDAGSFRTAAQAGLGERFAPLMARLKQGRLPRCVRQALTRQGTVTGKATEKDCRDCPLVTACLGKELLLCRLQSEGKTYGVLAVCVRPEFGEDPEERSLFEEAAGDVAFGLRSIEVEQERGQAEAALKASEERYRTLFQGAAEGILVADVETKRFVYANPAVCRMFGYKEEELTQMSVLDIHPKDALEHVLSEFEAQATGNKSLASGLPCLRSNGTVFYADIVTAPALIDGKACNVGFFTDVTERVGMRRELEENLVTLRRVFTQTVESLASAVEQRDPYTAGHQKRVAGLACAMGEGMGLDEERLTGLRLAATIHDVGKVYVPAEILSMPRRLNDAEFSLVQQHCEAGHSILKGIEFPWPVADAVLQHHERMDGSGYPRKLSGEGILLEARIIGVADVVEAMSSHRPYRPALGIDAALEEIGKGSGRLFDPAVVGCCVKLIRERGFKLGGNGEG